MYAQENDCGNKEDNDYQPLDKEANRVFKATSQPSEQKDYENAHQKARQDAPGEGPKDR